jgi:exosome complex component RRP42
VLETGGNLLDHICLAMKAALLDTRVPQVTVLDGVGAELPGEGAAGGEAGAAGGAGGRQAEIEVSDDPWQSRPLIAAEVADTVPVCITLSRVGRRTIADASLEEYAKRFHPLLFHLG